MHPRVFRIFACPVTLKLKVCAASTNRHRFPVIRLARVLAGYGPALNEAGLRVRSTMRFPAMRGF